jgi:hypothetical protein
MTTAASRGDASSLFATPKTVAERRADGSMAIQHQGDEPAAKAEAVTQ